MSNPITSYSALQIAVGDWLNRADLATLAPYLIFFAEAELNRTQRVFGMETVEYIDTTAGEKYLGYPSGYKGFRWLRHDQLGTRRLTYVTPEALQAEEQYGHAGKPLVYTLHGDRIEFGPQPDAVYRLEAGVFSDIPYLSDSNTSNWWLTNVPDLLLYGALIHAEPYLRNDDRVDTWKTAYNRALETLQTLDEQFRYPSGSLEQRRA